MGWRDRLTFRRLARLAASSLEEAQAALRGMEPRRDPSTGGVWLPDPNSMLYTANSIPFLEAAVDAAQRGDMETYQAQYAHLNRMMEYANSGAEFAKFDEEHDRVCVPGCPYREYLQR